MVKGNDCRLISSDRVAMRCPLLEREDVRNPGVGCVNVLSGRVRR